MLMPWHGVRVSPILPVVLYWLWFPLSNFSCRWQRDRDGIDTTFLLVMCWLCERRCPCWEARSSELVLCASYRKELYVSHDLIRLREPVQASKLLETGHRTFSCLLEYLVCMDFLPQLICLHFVMRFFLKNVFEFSILVPVILLFPTH